MKRTILLLVLAGFAAAQTWTVFFHDGGIVGKYGFLQAFPAFFSISLADPLLAAGLIDFMVVIALALWWMLSELPAAQRRSPRTALWIVSFCVFPGLGMLLYFLWLHPGHRLMQSPASRDV